MIPALGGVGYGQVLKYFTALRDSFTSIVQSIRSVRSLVLFNKVKL